MATMPGRPPSLTCAACGTLNEPSASFCGQCGMGLAREVRGGALATEEPPALDRPRWPRNAGT